LGDGHELSLSRAGLSVRHTFPKLRCIRSSSDDAIGGDNQGYLYFRIFQAILLTPKWRRT
jgi:hypothetical protein